jgi:hypothetical protein
LAAIPRLEGDNKDMEEDNIHVDMEEDNIDMEEVLTYRKRPYRCVKRPETTDAENSSDSSELSVCKNFFHIYIVFFHVYMNIVFFHIYIITF